MAMQYPEWIWHNGAIKRWAEATTHVMAHVVHYGSSVFEGIRSYQTPDGPVIFRLTDHNRRLFASAKIYDMAIPYSLDEINAACREVIRANENTTDYLRPVAYRGLGGFGLSADTPVEVAVATWKMGQYLGASVVEQGIDACRSEEHTSELQSRLQLVCRLLLEKKKQKRKAAVTGPDRHHDARAGIEPGQTLDQCRQS